MAATAQALSLPGLLEHIVTFLSRRSISRAMLVSRTWHGAATTKRIAQYRVLQPVNAPHMFDPKTMPRLQRTLYEKDSNFIVHPRLRGRNGGHFPEKRAPYHKTIYGLDHYDSLSSVLRAFATKPPCQAITVVTGRFYAEIEDTVWNRNGLRVGDLVALIRKLDEMIPRWGNDGCGRYYRRNNIKAEPLHVSCRIAVLTESCEKLETQSGRWRWNGDRWRLAESAEREAEAAAAVTVAVAS